MRWISVGRMRGTSSFAQEGMSFCRVMQCSRVTRKTLLGAPSRRPWSMSCGVHGSSYWKLLGAIDGPCSYSISSMNSATSSFVCCVSTARRASSQRVNRSWPNCAVVVVNLSSRVRIISRRRRSRPSMSRNSFGSSVGQVLLLTLIRRLDRGLIRDGRLAGLADHLI